MLKGSGIVDTGSQVVITIVGMQDDFTSLKSFKFTPNFQVTRYHTFTQLEAY